MDTNTYWTVYNEIDDRIYDGTPLFDNRKEAAIWFHANDGRPSSMVIRIRVQQINTD